MKKVFANRSQAKRAAENVNGTVIEPIRPARGFMVKLPDGSFLQNQSKPTKIEIDERAVLRALCQRDDEFARSFS